MLGDREKRVWRRESVAEELSNCQQHEVVQTIKGDKQEGGDVRPLDGHKILISVIQENQTTRASILHRSAKLHHTQA